MWWRVVLGLLIGAALFAAGRLSVTTPDDYAAGVRDGRALQVPPAARDAFDDGYQAGANDVFGGYDGGWDLGRPYTITLARGEDGITYRIRTRKPAP